MRVCHAAFHDLCNNQANHHKINTGFFLNKHSVFSFADTKGYLVSRQSTKSYVYFILDHFYYAEKCVITVLREGLYYTIFTREKTKVHYRLTETIDNSQTN